MTDCVWFAQAAQWVARYAAPAFALYFKDEKTRNIVFNELDCIYSWQMLLSLAFNGNNGD